MKKQSLVHSVISAMIAIISSIMMTSQAFAHPGHDHSANSSMLIHILFYGSIIAALGVCAWVGYRYVTQQNNK